MDFGVHFRTRGCLTSREDMMALAQRAEPLAYAYPGSLRRTRTAGGCSADMLADAAALEAVGVRHVMFYPQRPTIENKFEVLQRFGEEVVRKA
ncbi:MAG: hypothetical protein WA864_24430 [Acetobacteraceae bacterium]